MTQLSAF